MDELKIAVAVVQGHPFASADTQLPNFFSFCFFGVLFFGTSECKIFNNQQSFCLHSSVGDLLKGTVTLLGEAPNLHEAPLLQHC